MADNDDLTPAIGDLRVSWAKAEAESLDIDTAVRRFAPPLRREVRKLIRSTPRAADLAVVFPGMLAALALRRGQPDRRREALQLIDSGAQLKYAARVLDMPMWMRRLAPDAFNVGLPDALPQSERFGRRIAARMPGRYEDSALWLAGVLFAERAAGEDFAVWVAQQRIFQGRARAECMLAVLAAYAWHSSARDAEASKLIAVPWRPRSPSIRRSARPRAGSIASGSCCSLPRA